MKNFTSDIVIGLEIHCQLNTDSKLFCGCATQGSDEPNTRTCAVCLGMPGSKPVLNKKAVEHALKLCLALGCKIAPELIFSRKSYFYPDMSKNYQITQYEMPLGTNGELMLGSGKKIRIKRVHIEEDPASLVHTEGAVLVDYNRSGNPLVEIVTEPELESAEEARDFMKQLITVLNYLGIFDIDNCIIKADANVSVKETGYERVEIKNITGFKEIERALKYEIERHKAAAFEKEKITMETRGWDAEKGASYLLRKKEAEEEYGYIIDTDLAITDITAEMISRLKKEMPELAADKIQRYIKDYKIAEDDARIIASERLLAELFEKISEEIDAVLAARWLRKELLRVLNYNEKEISEVKIDAKHIIELLKMVEEKVITDKTAKEILEKLIVEPFSPKDYVLKMQVKKIVDVEEIKKICEEVVKENPKAAEDYKKGEEKSFNFLVGMVIRKSKGKAAPEIVNKIMKEIIGK